MWLWPGLHSQTVIQLKYAIISSIISNINVIYSRQSCIQWDSLLFLYITIPELHLHWVMVTDGFSLEENNSLIVLKTSMKGKMSLWSFSVWSQFNMWNTLRSYVGRRQAVGSPEVERFSWAEHNGVIHVLSKHHDPVGGKRNINQSGDYLYVISPKRNVLRVYCFCYNIPHKNSSLQCSIHVRTNLYQQILKVNWITTVTVTASQMK